MMTDLISSLSKEELSERRFSTLCISPDDAKYYSTSKKLRRFLSAEAEWRECANIQYVLLDTRKEFGKAEQWHVDEVFSALDKIDPLNMTLLEEKITKHDQLAVIEEIGRYVSLETKALLHPGTTSYDIVDTARSSLIKKCWFDVMRPVIVESIEMLCVKAEKLYEIMRAGRTHIQATSPVSFGATFAGYALRLAERVKLCDMFASDLRGKISGIVGTGASIEMVIGEGLSLEFENKVLDKLGLKPDTTATQVVQKERLADFGHSLTILIHVLGDLANDMRLLYSTEINEIGSLDSSSRLGGSSADATKDNPINWENIAGTPSIVEGGMRTLYEMIDTDLERDLRSSKQARYQPKQMMAEVYESFVRFGKAIKDLFIREDSVTLNLQKVRDNPGDAMTSILRGERWTHSVYGVGHNFVKEIGKRAKHEKPKLLDVALEDSEFSALYSRLSENKQEILSGKLELYIGHSLERAKENVANARTILVG